MSTLDGWVLVVCSGANGRFPLWVDGTDHTARQGACGLRLRSRDCPAACNLGDHRSGPLARRVMDSLASPASARTQPNGVECVERASLSDRGDPASRECG